MKNQKKVEKKEEKKEKTTLQLTTQEELGKKVVEGLRKGKFGDPKIKTPIEGKIFVFNHKNSVIKVSGLRGEGKIHPRYLITITTDKDVDHHLRIPGKYARLAWKAVSEEPKVSKKIITPEEVEGALEALEL